MFSSSVRAVSICVFALVLGIGISTVRAEEVEEDRLRIELEVVEEPSSFWDSVRRISQLLKLRSGGIVRPPAGTKFRVTAVAYSPTVDQNDLSPCITASGARVAPDVVATNFLPFGTKLKINGKEYVVRDRMNAKYNGKYIIDIWHPTRREALTFGRQTLQIEIVGYEEKVKKTVKTSELVASPSPTATLLAEATPDAPAAPAVEEPATEDAPRGVFATLGDLLRRFATTRTFLPDAKCF